MNANDIVDELPAGYRWATALETELWADYADRMVQVRVGGTDDEPWTDLAIKDDVPPAEDRPTLREEAERLLSYWEIHGESPEAVAKWAVTDMLGILRFIAEEES